MKTKTLILAFASLLSYSAHSATQCGPFFLKGESDGLMHINGQAPETQKMTFLKQKDDFDNVMMQWMLPDPNVGRWLGFDYVKRNKKAILNVEVVRVNMDEPREFWTYDCVKVN
ncbi:hypothetical protein [Rahnella sp. PCH160]|uniref:hypothetical protein n=1 Tax=Rahnella sp. PCH160 TaxID=3447928 RepID=UPI0039FC1B6F